MRAGGAAALPYFRGRAAVALKAGGAVDPVSDADHASEAAIVALLQRERPGDGILGEEGTDTPGERRWVVDGLDGTLNFLRGIPVWCVAVAVSDAGGAVASAVHDPVAGELWSAARGEGAHRDGARLALGAGPPLRDAIVTTYVDRARIRWPGAAERQQRLAHAAGAVRIADRARWSSPGWPAGAPTPGRSRGRTRGTGCPARCSSPRRAVPRG